MLREAENTVKIEGILSEIDLNYGSYVKNGKTIEDINGVIKIKVTQKINGEDVETETPVHMFAAKYKNNGDTNPAYESIERIKNEYVSIADAGGEEGADRVRITSGKITMNTYPSKTTGQIVSFPRITASFVSRIKKEDCKPQATFSTELYVGQVTPEVDTDGVETGRLKVKSVIPMYGGKVEVVPFVAVAPGVVNAISSYWHEGDTVKASGRLNFSSKTETILKEVDFGEPIETTRTVNISDLVLTGGSQTPMDDNYAFNHDEIKSALAERNVRLEAQKQRSIEKAKNKTTAAPASNKPTAADLGF